VQVVLTLQSCSGWNNPNREQDAADFSYSRRKLTHMIMVAGHSVYTGTDFTQAKDNSNWFLVPYQQIPGTAESLVQHIQMGVEVSLPLSRVNRTSPRIFVWPMLALRGAFDLLWLPRDRKVPHM
jgi:hypothetical protein